MALEQSSGERHTARGGISYQLPALSSSPKPSASHARESRNNRDPDPRLAGIREGLG